MREQKRQRMREQVRERMREQKRERVREQVRERMREQKRERVRERVREQLDLLGHLGSHRRHAAGTHDGRCAVVREAVRHYFCNR